MNEFAHRKNKGFKRTNWTEFEQEVIQENANKDIPKPDETPTITVEVTHDSSGKPYRNRTWIQKRID